MDAEIDPTERRLLGVLIEKQLATPEGYPLSVRDLLVGANQKTCRNPVTNLEEWQIEGALASLFEKKWATYVDGGRVRKWKHRADEKLGLTPTRFAVLAELLLRGPQQPGELRRNAERLANIPTDQDLQSILDDLAAKAPPLVMRLPRLPRERDARWTQLLAPDVAADGSVQSPAPPSGGAAPEAPAVAPKPAATFDPSAVLARLDALEREVAALKTKLGA